MIREVKALQPFPFAELKNNKSAQNNGTILLSIFGIVYDVTEFAEQFFGPGRAYEVFAGRDITYALAKMSLKAKDCDVFQFTLDMKTGDLQTLAEWIAYFDALYKRKYFLVDLPSQNGRYPMKFTDLPPLLKEKKMGNTKYGGERIMGNATQQNDYHRKLQKAYESTLIEREKRNGISTRRSSSAPVTKKNDDQTLMHALMNKTKLLHTRVIRTKLMHLCVQGDPRVRRPYKIFISSLYYVYRELEPSLTHSLFDGIHSPKLDRLPNLEEDLQFFFGKRFQDIMPGPNRTTIRYVTRIHDISFKPHLLLVHHWMRYGAGLAGGQFLRVSLERAFNLKPKRDENSPLVVPTPGIRYHQFEKIDDLPQFYNKYLRNLDEIGKTFNEKQIQEMIAEAQYAFALNIELNEEVIQTHGAKL